MVCIYFHILVHCKFPSVCSFPWLYSTVDYVTGSMRQSKRVGFDLIEEIYDRKTFLVFWRIFELVFFFIFGRAIEHPTYSALTRPLCELSSLVPPQVLAPSKKLRVCSYILSFCLYDFNKKSYSLEKPRSDFYKS